LRELGAFWGVDDVQLRCLWQGLRRAKWQRATDWNAVMVGYERQPLTLHDLLPQGGCAPVVLLGLIEELVWERRLSRTTATQVQEQALACVDARGHWRGVPPAPRPGPAWEGPDGYELAQVMHHYWR